MLRRALVFLFAAITFFVAIPNARADLKVDLYTVGPGSQLFSRYGHSLLCVRDEADADGQCYDYGVPDREDAMHMTWASIRGEPIFIAIRIPESVAINVFRDQGRAIERQHLPLAQSEAKSLADRLEGDVATRRAYAYHPYFANCTTQLRDRIDEQTGGRLRAGKSGPATMRFRDLAEEGLSGRAVELTTLAFILGSPSERKPSPWEAMFLPNGLRDGVAERFSALPEHVADHQAVVLPTSRAVGRLFLVLLAFVLFAVVRYGARGGMSSDALSPRFRRSLFVVAAVLGTMALVVELVAVVVVWPEFRQNWALLFLLPTDFALPFLRPKTIRSYARARIVMAGLAVLLEIGGVIGQPMIPLAVLIALPMAGLASALREANEETSSVALPAR